MTVDRSPSLTLLRRRQRLLERIHRSYDTATQPVRIGPVELNFTRIADPDRVLDRVAAEADLRERLSGKRDADEHLHLPYWAELWDSAMAVGQFLVRGWVERRDAGTRGRGDTAKENCGKAPSEDGQIISEGEASSSSSLSASPRPRVSASPKILDLGCGMGLSGTVAAALGAKVLFADIETPALLFARLNSLPWSSRVRTRKLNWRTDRLDERFDLIIGADILYERAQWEHQEPFLRHHLAPGGTVLLGEPGRQTGDLFVDWIRGHDWNLELFLEPVPTRTKPVRIFRIAPIARGSKE